MKKIFPQAQKTQRALALMLVFSLIAGLLAFPAQSAVAAEPDEPVITILFTDPAGVFDSPDPIPEVDVNIIDIYARVEDPNDIQISIAQFRINGGNWFNIVPQGSYDEPGEDLVFSTPFMPNGSYTLEIRAQNTVGTYGYWTQDFTVNASEPVRPANDEPGGALVASSVPYTHTMSTTSATLGLYDQPALLCDLEPGYASVWYQYTPSAGQSLLIDTFGSTYDTYIAIWTGSTPGSYTEVACNDDASGGIQSRVSLNAESGTTYYIQVAENRSNYVYPTDVDDEPISAQAGGTLKLNVYTGVLVDVTIGGDLMGEYVMGSPSSRVEKYGVDGGPVVISSGDGAKIIASLNQWRRRPNTPEWTGVAQSMALPVDQISNIYVMPRYDYSNPSRLYNTILLANVDTIERVITVTIGGTEMGQYTLGPSESQYALYRDLAGGPVVVSSDEGAKIIASLYELRRDPSTSGWNGQSEMMGLPGSQLSDKYLIPQYFGAANPNTLDARLFIANADSVTREITISIGGTVMGIYTLLPNTNQVLKYAVDGGPVEISSDPGAKIIASLNQWRRRPGTSEWTGVAQSMALPVDQISNIYVIPRYDYSNPSRLYNTILIANVDTVERVITVTIGGTEMGQYTLGPSESEYVLYRDLAGGPVVVSSDEGAKIIASLYELRRDPSLSGWNGQSEMMGLPGSQLSDKYIIPVYFGAANPNTLDARLFIGVP